MPLVRADLTEAQYGNALAALHGVHASTEPGILGLLATMPGVFDYLARRKLAAISADLQALHRLPLAPATAMPALRSVAELVGVLYTIEGATQGGQFIARNLHGLPPPRLPSAFFDGYGEQTAALWQTFWEFAESRCPAQDHSQAISTAVATFEAIRQHLDSCLATLNTPS
jgi:heme oxygenase